MNGGSSGTVARHTCVGVGAVVMARSVTAGPATVGNCTAAYGAGGSGLVSTRADAHNGGTVRQGCSADQAARMRGQRSAGCSPSNRDGGAERLSCGHVAL